MEQVSVSQDVCTPSIGRAGETLLYKRPFDLVLGSLLFVLLLPIALLLALVVKLTSRGPILFRQERVGLEGSRFLMYKFRTMYDGSDPTLHREYFKQYQRGIAAPSPAGKAFKLKRDPRVTGIGGILRCLALDEIPQLLNVIKGDMSLVGPRPAIPYEVELYGQRDLLRVSVKPGITGLWQIKGRDVVDFATMIDLDLEYIAGQSMARDLTIVLATVPALLLACLKRQSTQASRSRGGP